MPVVRIIGSLPESLRDLPNQLRDRGFDLQTSSDAAEGEPKFELTLEECPTEAALARALALAEGNDVSILVSPGVIAPAPVFGPTGTQAEPIKAVEGFETTSLDTVESEPQTPVLTREQPLAAINQTLAVPDDVPATAAPAFEATPQTEEPKPVHLSESLNELPPDFAFDRTAAGEASRQEEVPIADEAAPFPYQESREFPLDAAELCDTPEEPRIEELNEPASLPDLDSVQPEPVAALYSSDEDDSDWPIWQAVREEEEVPPAVVVPAQSGSPILTETIAELYNFGRRFLAAAQVNRVLLNDRLFTKIASVTAGTAILLLVLGLTAHRFSPLPRGILRGSSLAAQPAPFQRQTAVPAPTRVSDVVPADAAQPVTPAVFPALARSHVRRSSKVTRKHASISGADFVAKDTVIRYTQKPSLPPQIAKKQSGVKYYTDLKSK